jgi:hypothetical protein
MPGNWRAIFNRLWPAINTPGTSYFGGPRFVGLIQDVIPDFPAYKELMEEREKEGKSTARRDYYYDLLMELPEGDRARVVRRILDLIADSHEFTTADIRSQMVDSPAVPDAVIPDRAWSADRLNHYLREIDDAISLRRFDRAVTLSYTCLEGSYKAFYRAKQNDSPPDDLIDLAKWIWNYLRTTIDDYPDEVLALIKTTAHALDRARNKFSESHFEGEAAEWLATYFRDLTHAQIRLLLHFI